MKVSLEQEKEHPSHWDSGMYKHRVGSLCLQVIEKLWN